MSFTSKDLQLTAHPLPSSIPLIVEGDMEWDRAKNLLVKSKSNFTGQASLKVIEEALELLSSISKPIAVLSLCGPYRTGKSFLVSSILGNPGAFKIGHSMESCTRGVWMSTTILEREDLAVVLLDTEGMDSVDGEGSLKADFINKMMMVTTLLSSLLVYNSTGVPEWSDLEELSCFSQLSSSLLLNDEHEYDSISKNFPDFVWLIRDSQLDLPAGVDSPTTFLMENVLRRSANAKKVTTEDCIVNAILRLFSSITCLTLPSPSADPNVLSSIVEKQDLLNPKFKAELQDLIDYTKQHVRVKSLCGRECKNGTMWGELVSKFVDLVNHDDQLALTNTYVAAAESALSKLSLKLVEEYKCEMKQRMDGKFPMEEYSSDPSVETLLSIHYSIWYHKQQKFVSQVDYLLSVSSEDEHAVLQKKEAALSSFMNAICKLSDTESGQQIKDGVLYQFALENRNASRHHCRISAKQAFRKVRDAILATEKNKPKADLNDIMTTAEQAYYAQAIGPAKDEIYLQNRQELDESCKEIAETIPGKPIQFHLRGMSKNKIKLRWNGTGCRDGTTYEVQFAFEHDKERWLLLPDRFDRECAMIRNLKPNTDFLFQVRGVGSTGRKGQWSETLKCSTTVGAIARGAATVGTFIGGILAAPAGGTVIFPVLGTIGGAAAAPIVGTLWAKKVYEKLGPQGELQSDSDNEQADDAESSSIGAESSSTASEATLTESKDIGIEKPCFNDLQ